MPAMGVTAVVSNRPDLQPLADALDAPFIHLPMSAQTQAAREVQLLDVIEQTKPELSR